MRLRPSGDAGVLCSSLSAFQDYQLNEAWTWEKQALVRSRAVYGSTELRQQYETIRQLVLATPRDLTQLKIDVSEMREKMYEHLANHNEHQFNIKTDRGGITDIEFIAQYLVLANAPQNPDLAHWSDNVRIFDIMAEHHIIPQKTAEQLKECYTSLRNRIHHLNLLGQPSITTSEEFAQVRSFIGEIWRTYLQ